MTFFEELTNHLTDPKCSGIYIEEELEPVAGPHAPIAPPTYAREPGSRDSAPNFALSPNSMIPKRDASGWFFGHEQAGDEPRRGVRVVINAVAACAGDSETGLYRQQHRIGVRLPGFVVSGHDTNPDAKKQAVASVLAKEKIKELRATQQAEIDAALRVSASSWTLPHRYADSWLQFAALVDGRQVWASDDDVKKILLQVSQKNGDITFTHAPNAAVYGNWLSSGTAARNAIPRAYACEITGYGASEVVRGTTKLDGMGGASSTTKLAIHNDEVVLDVKSNKSPSELGFGQVPDQAVTRAVTCELVLRQASVSLKALNRFQYADDESGAKKLAATRVYCLLALIGHRLAAEESFLRSGCDLISVSEQWGWRSHGVREPELFDAPSVDVLAEALRFALDEARKVGLEFADERRLQLSDAEMQLIVSRVLKEGGSFEAGE